MTALPHPQGACASHYERLLAPIYAWMLGDRPSALRAAGDQLDRAGIEPRATPGQRALDLGAGLGLHAVTLAKRGYATTALDTSLPLLAELSASLGRGDRPLAAGAAALLAPGGRLLVAACSRASSTTRRRACA
jgi:hypothetical protein